MKERLKELSKEILELRELISINEKFISHVAYLNLQSKCKIAINNLCSNGNCTLSVKDNSMAQECCALYKLLEKSKCVDAPQIRYLCKEIFFKIIGYRIEDAYKIPCMNESIHGKSLIETSNIPNENARENMERLIRESAKKKAFGEPQIISNLMIALPLIGLIWYLLDKFYEGSSRYTFGVSVIMGAFLGVLGMEGHYHLLTHSVAKIKYYFYLCSWRLTWKIFEYPSRIKHQYEQSKLKYIYDDKRLCATTGIGIWYFIMLYLMFFMVMFI